MSEGGGGHGASWIVTYSDMITLLMTLFIVIVTFGSREQDKFSKKLDSLVGGLGGSGMVGEGTKGPTKDSVMQRVSPLGRSVYNGSETPPMYSDPYPDATNMPLIPITKTPIGKLSDGFSFRVPVDFLFSSPDKLSTSGKRFLDEVARSIRLLPYDLQVQAGSRSRMPAAARVNNYLFETAGIHPGRLGVALAPAGERQPDDVLRIALIRNR